MNITEMLAAGNNMAKELVRDPRKGLDGGKDDNSLVIWYHAKWLNTLALEDAKFLDVIPGLSHAREGDAGSRWELPNGVWIYTDGTYVW